MNIAINWDGINSQTLGMTKQGWAYYTAYPLYRINSYNWRVFWGSFNNKHEVSWVLMSP